MKKKKIKKSLGVLPGNELLYTESMGIMGHFLYNTKKSCYFFPVVPKISDHSVINAPKINAKENCQNINVLSRKLLHLGQGNCWNGQNIPIFGYLLTNT